MHSERSPRPTAPHSQSNLGTNNAALKGRPLVYISSNFAPIDAFSFFIIIVILFMILQYQTLLHNSNNNCRWPLTPVYVLFAAGLEHPQPSFSNRPTDGQRHLARNVFRATMNKIRQHWRLVPVSLQSTRRLTCKKEQAVEQKCNKSGCLSGDFVVICMCLVSCNVIDVLFYLFSPTGGSRVNFRLIWDNDVAYFIWLLVKNPLRSLGVREGAIFAP